MAQRALSSAYGLSLRVCPMSQSSAANAKSPFSRDVCVVGGGGHVGLPLALTFADVGRRTVFPGISKLVQKFIDDRGLDIHVAYCPERVAQGYSIKEFRELPQIISAFDRTALNEVRELFGRFTPEFVEMEVMEAELCKL